MSFQDFWLTKVDFPQLFGRWRQKKCEPHTINCELMNKTTTSTAASTPSLLLPLLNHPFTVYILREFWVSDGLGTLREPMLAVLSSLRNSDKLIFPSLSMSASSRSGSIEPLSPVCCREQNKAVRRMGSNSDFSPMVFINSILQEFHVPWTPIPRWSPHTDMDDTGHLPAEPWLDQKQELTPTNDIN